MIDMNGFEEQSEGGGNYTVPADSIVKLRVGLQGPGDYPSDQDPMLAMSQNNNHSIRLVYTVVGSQYEGARIFDSLIVMSGGVGGSDKAKQIAQSRLRAIVESHRRVDPKDKSEASAKQRQITSWNDLEGMEFVAKLKYGKPNKKGYTNNEIKTVITADKKEYLGVMNGTPVITNTPIPARVDDGGGYQDNGYQSAGAATAAPTGQKPTWQ